MTLTDLLPWLNLLLFPVLGYVIRIENRVTRLEALREAEKDQQDGWQHRRRTDNPTC